MPKKCLFTFYFFTIILTLSAQNFERLDRSIETLANNVIRQIILKNIPDVFDFDTSPSRIRTAILDFDSSSNALSEYALSEFTNYFVNHVRFTIVDRHTLDMAKEELKLGTSLDFEDETAAKMGHLLGAQVVIFGSIKPLGNIYRMQARAIAVEKGILLAQENINLNGRDVRPFIASRPTPAPVSPEQASQRIEEERRRRELESQREEEEKRRREQERQLKVRERKEKFDELKNKLDELKDNASTNFIQWMGLAFQSDEDFSYAFGEFGIRWSFLPFTSLGIDLAFGGHTKEPDLPSRTRAQALANMGLKPEEDASMPYGYTAMSAGIVFPLTKTDSNMRILLLGEGLIQYGTTIYPGLLGYSLTPGFSAGFSIAFTDFLGLDVSAGWSIRYKGLWYENNRHTNGLIVGFIIHPNMD